MAKTNENNSTAGSAALVRSLVAEKETDNQIIKIVSEKFPFFARESNLHYLQNRINAARKATRAKNEKPATKAATAPAKAPAKKPTASTPAPATEPVSEPMPG